MEKKRLNVWVEAELYDRALERAKTEDLTLSQVVRRFLRQYVAQVTTDAPSQSLRETPVDED
jgi:hypothetical protein